MPRTSAPANDVPSNEQLRNEAPNSTALATVDERSGVGELGGIQSYAGQRAFLEDTSLDS